MLPRLYAELLLKLSASQKNEAKSVDHFLEVLKARGHERLLPRIVSEFERVCAREKRRGGVSLRVARKGDSTRYRAQAERAIAAAGSKTKPVEVVDESIVSGFSLEGADFRYDASARRALITLFETLSA